MRVTQPPATCCFWMKTRCSVSRLTLSVSNLPASRRPLRRASVGSSRGDGAFSTSRRRDVGLRRAPASGRDGSPGSTAAGNALGVVGPDGEHDYADFRLSPDETRLAASLVNPKMARSRHLADRSGSEAANNNSRLVRWSTSTPRRSGPRMADGIVFRSNRNGVHRAVSEERGRWWQRPAVAARWTPRGQRARRQSNLAPSDWSPDGQSHRVRVVDPRPISGSCPSPTTRSRSPGATRHQTRCTPTSRPTADSSPIPPTSPDGIDVYVETLPPSDRKWPISTNGGYEPRWRADSREIYYLSEDRQADGGSGLPRRQSHLAFPSRSSRPMCTGGQLAPHALRPQPGRQRFLVHTRSRDLGARLNHGGVELDRRVEEMSSVFEPRHVLPRRTSLKPRNPLARGLIRFMVRYR